MLHKRNTKWTADDDKRLLELKAAGKSARIISAALKRTLGSVNTRFGVLKSKDKRGMSGHEKTDPARA